MTAIRHKKLYQRVVLQSRNAEGSAQEGSVASDWTDVAPCYAEVLPLEGKELTAAQATWPDVKYRVTIRYRAGVDSSMRFVYKTQFLEVNGVLNVAEANRYLECFCSDGIGVSRG